MSSLPLATRWSTSVLYRWYNAGKVWAHKNPVEDLSFLIKIAKKRIMYQEEFLQILSTHNVVKNRYSICQFVMDCQSHFSEGVFRDDDFWDPWWGSAIRNCI